MVGLEKDQAQTVASHPERKGLREKDKKVKSRT